MASSSLPYFVLIIHLLFLFDNLPFYLDSSFVFKLRSKKMYSGIKLITFDAVNTLFKVSGSVGNLYATAMNHYIPNKFEHLTREDETRINEEFLKIYKNYYRTYPNFGYGLMSSQQFWNEIVSYTFRNSNQFFKADTMNKLTSQLYDDFCTAENWQVFPEVYHVLLELNKLGVTIGIVSNFDERLNIILENLDLKNYFDFVICSRELGHAKPDMKIFETALNIAGVSSKNSLHIGDNVELDFQPATTVGMNALLINRTSNQEEKVNSKYQVISLCEVLSRL